jgi:hypothetical protein
VSTSYSLTPPTEDPTTRIVEEVARREATCRCGTKLPVGSLRYELRGLPPSVHSLLEAQAFCSHRCLRAYFLETMELFDVMTNANAEQIVGDLHTVYQATVQAYAHLLLDEGTQS